MTVTRDSIPTESPAWIAVDWGSSHLRAWAMAEDGRVLARGRSACGMLSLTPARYETALLEVVDRWLPPRGSIEVLVCGMAGARQGWREAAYLGVPTSLEALYTGAVSPGVSDPRLRVHLLPGLCQHRDAGAGDFDVMRGEETQLAGLVAMAPGFTGPACLPGTHAKWARLEQGVLASFHTFLTGELYQLLAERSVLAHSLGSDDPLDPGCRDAFAAAVRESAAAPERFTSRLFGIRASDLLDDTLPVGRSRGALLSARLSGLVIGMELAGTRHARRPDEAVTLIGTGSLCRRYALALEALGIHSRIVDGEAATLAGLDRARRHLTPSSQESPE
ncbi:2-dehydro-3-deoxygalactonokinase [Halomonas sp. C05BenzN]|uniref:2-dehydro-3-deoxygalactonokinase n=1 Tax=Halomonas sp. C05BenzN TaxID=3411041 RepID=UPI003B9483FE